MEDIKDFAWQATSAGVAAQLEVWPGLFHIRQLMAGLMPEGRRAINDLSRFMQPAVGLPEEK